MKVRKLGGLAGMLGAGAVALGMGGEADAGIMTFDNVTFAPGIGVSSTLTLKNINGVSEGLDGNDGIYMAPSPNAIEIYSNVGGTLLSTDSRPINTTGWDIYLGIKGSVTNIDNSFLYQITDTSDLAGKTLTLFDVITPATTYDLNMDGNPHSIALPNLTGVTGEYRHYRVATPEPSSLIMLGTGAIAAGAWGLARLRANRGRGRKEEYEMMSKEE